MKNFYLFFLVLAIFASYFVPLTAQQTKSQMVYALVDIDKIGQQRLQTLKKTEGLVWWVEADRQLLVLTEQQNLRSSRISHSYKTMDIPAIPDNLYVVNGTHKNELKELGAQILIYGGRAAVVQATKKSKLHRHFAEKSKHCCDISISKFIPNVVLSRQVDNAAHRTVTFATSVQTAVNAVDVENWYDILEQLVPYNRYTKGREVTLVRDWLVQQLQALSGLQVSTSSFSVGASTGYNVIAVLPGTQTPNDWYIIGAHYDSTSQRPYSEAPGAEDNGSGLAAVLEMARIFSMYRPKSTLIFILFSGEEQGLYGSKDHAASLVASGDDDKVKGVLTMDMIGYTSDSDLDCLIESERFASNLVDTFVAAAGQYTSMRTVVSYNPYGSDHMSYLNKGMETVLVIENDWADYPDYHRTGDTIGNVSKPMAKEIMKMDVAVIAQLAGLQ